MTPKNGHWLESVLQLPKGSLSEGTLISGLAYDSRKVEPGFLFFAVTGFQADGNVFAGKAAESGASVIISEQSKPDSLDFRNWIQVQSVRKAMAVISRSFYDEPDRRLKLIGVTGTNGKTTTTFLIRQILEFNGLKTGVVGTTGAFYGDLVIPLYHTTPESPDLCRILKEMADSGVEAVAMEVSSHALVLDRVTGLEFRAAVFTNLTHDHLDFHKTPDAYLEAKKLLFDRLPVQAEALLNSDDPAWTKLVSDSRATVKTYSLGQPATLTARIHHSDISRQEIEVTELNQESYRFTYPLAGQFNVLNGLAAWLAARSLGLKPEQITGALSEGIQVPGRFEKVTTVKGLVTGVVDYSHTPDSLQKIIEAINLIKQPGQTLITVFGCGGDRDKTKRPVMGRLAESLSDYTIVTSDNPRTEDPSEILKDILDGMSGTQSESELDRRLAIRKAAQRARPGDIILVAGKGHETYQEVRGVRHHFDDREELREALMLYGC